MSGQRFACFCCSLLAIAVGGSLAIVMLSDPAHRAALNIVLVTQGSDPYQQALALGAQAAARERGVNLTIRSTQQSSIQDTTEAIDNLSNEGINGVVVCQTTSDSTSVAVEGLMERANVITCGEDVGPANRLCHVGTGNYSSGRICANLVKQTLPDGGRIVVLVDDVYRGIGAERLAGFFESLRLVDAASDGRGQQRRYGVVECLEDQGRPEVRAQNLRLALARHPDVSCVVDLGTGSRSSSIGRLAIMARARAVKLVTFDRSDAALTAVETGEVFAVVGDNPFTQGYQAVARLVNFCRGGAMGLPVRGRGHVNIPATVVRQDNVATYRAQVHAGLQSPAA